MNIKLLDCTLRDGGHVNQAMFGRDRIQKIIGGLTEAGVDYVELGFLRDGSFSDQQALYNDVTEIYGLLPEQKGNTVYTVMIRPDWYDIRQLSHTDGRIDTIRFAFYYRDYPMVKEYARIARGLGYKIICNPVNIMGYSDAELAELLLQVNDLHPEQLTIVDTYGALTFLELHRVYERIEERLDPDINLGLHLHENQALSFGLVQDFLRIRREDRKVRVDASLLGMGRMPGNLCLELIADYLNEQHGAEYQMDSIYRLIGECIQPIKEQTPWGYSPAYFITAKYGMHRSYAEWLLKKEDLSLCDIYKILQRITDKNDRNVFSAEYIERLYDEYSRQNEMEEKR